MSLRSSSLTADQKTVLRSQIRNAAKLNDTFLFCRLLGHAWTPVEPDRDPMFGRLFVFECARCTSKRDDILTVDGTGRLLARSYRYAEGYLLQKRKASGKEQRGGRMLSADALRAELIRRDSR